MRIAHAGLGLFFVLTTTLAGCAGGSEEVAAGEDDLTAKKQLLCASSASEPVYYGAVSQILLTADVTSKQTLGAASLTMATRDQLGVRNEELKAQERYSPRNPTYVGLEKYNAADAWCGYSVLAPKNLKTKTGTFSVYVQQSCEGGFFSTAELHCKVAKKTTNTPPAPNGAGQVVLRYDADGKQYVIDGGYFEASAFTGNDIVVSSAETSIDIDRLLPDSDPAPGSVCYRGDVATVKKILWSMLGNTDGNGDHWLDDGAKIKSAAQRKLVVDFSVTGEGGSTPHTLDVVPCE